MAAPLSSMTGFARVDGGDGGMTWTWELKSVNGKGLDLRCRLPAGWDAMEQPLRQKAAARLRRGNVQVGFQYASAAARARPRIDAEAFAELYRQAVDLAQSMKLPRPEFETILALRGVVEVAEEPDDPETREARLVAALADFDKGLERLAADREAEGARLGAVVEGHLAEVAGLVARARTLAVTQPEALRARLKEQVEALLQASPALSEERLAQEAALLATKADIREELDRLDGHVEAARALLAEGQAVGRRLDFLCQEFGREANTLCSKSSDLDLTRLGLDLKAAIDRLKEQIQNLE
ncbi:TIGR00255 family protein [Tistlia consotensis]|uniref:TIGR00255 family protein n=1 Tax=Tistlia consotensis USBA 355 TaxID=560819 RepID=A0A1Y6CXG1_9PROT|nr:YicC/YloC family endoribonuclease [Tistlia consotensis]SMF83373.1 TIGR00255 family protein [Tistlia consotensis USBA 355]SNS32830.1 TIGR00255 family protein [Tistlia consotensis]